MEMNNPALQDLKNQKPTESWKESMNEPLLDDGEEPLFTVKAISESEQILDRFLDELDALDKNPSDQTIMLCVKKVVLSLNELNENHEFIIETMEREDLCEFILRAVAMAGLQTDDDVTEEWRDF